MAPKSARARPLAGATILQVIPALDAGGAERTTIEICEALRAAGAQALVASAGGRMEGELAGAGGELVRMPAIGAKTPWAMAANTDALARLIRARGVDLVHARSRAPAWPALWAARRTGRAVVTTYHGVYRARSGLKRLYNSVMARGDAVIANSDFTARHVRSEHPFAAGRLVTIPRGVDAARFDPAAVGPERVEALRAEWGGGDGVLILLPARLTGWKGHHEAIRAAAVLRATHADGWRMVFAGDPQGRDGYREALLRRIGEEGLDERIRIVGHCTDMPAALQLADIVLAPSIEAEAFGRVAAEAGAMGRPVAAGDLGAQPEVVADGVTGFIAPPGDAQAVAAALGRLIDMGERGRAEMGARARARVLERFTTAALQRATLEVYQRLLERPR